MRHPEERRAARLEPITRQAEGDSLTREQGLIAAKAIVRFRSNFKDLQDIVFVFLLGRWALRAGTNVVLHWYLLVKIGYYDGMLRFSVMSESTKMPGVVINSK